MKPNFVKTLRFSHYVSKFVEVSMVKKEKRQGWLYTIDPISGDLALINFSEDMTPVNASLVIADCVKDVILLKEPDEAVQRELDKLFKPSEATGEELESKKDAVYNWLKKNCFPVKDNDNSEIIEVGDFLKIRPPYTPESCECSNLMVMERIQTLLKQMPA